VITALVCALVVLPGRSKVQASRFDIGGAVALSIAVVGASVLLSEGDLGVELG